MPKPRSSPEAYVLIVTTIIVARRWFALGREAMRGALVTFLFFIIITAVACAAGRLDPAWDSDALQFRYTTPPLFAWIALIVLGAPSFNLRRTLTIFACVAILSISKADAASLWTQARGS